MLRWSVLAIAVVVDLPTVWAALIDQSISVETMLIRLLVTVPIVAVLLAAVRVACRQAPDRPADRPAEAVSPPGR